MEDLNGAAPAAAEPISAPEPTVETPVSPPNPVHTEATPEPAKAEPKTEAKKAPSIDEALDNATKKVETQAKEKPAEKAEPKTEAKRDETGKFAPKEPADKPAETVEAKPAAEQAPKPATPRSEAPSRFSADAKAAWETAPEPVKAEVHRAIRELEEGHQKYKASHEAYEQVRQFDDIAKQNGGNLKHSLEKIVDMENTMKRDPIAGLQKVADHFGLNLRAVAAHIMGQTPDQVQQSQDATIRELNAKIAKLEQTVGGVTKTFEEQRTTQTLSQVQSFAKDHPRFEELSEAIAEEIQHGYDLDKAYERAERLNPAPAPAPNPVASSAPAPAPAAQTDKGTKSIAGAPSPGSNPALRKVSKSIDESIDRAFAMRG